MEKTPVKTQLVNLALIDFMAATKKKGGSKIKKKASKVTKQGDFPWYQPSTQSQYLRVFFGTAQKIFGWGYGSSGFNLSQGLIGFLGNLYKKREKELGHVSICVCMFYYITDILILL